MEIAQVLDKVVPPCESFISYSSAVLNCTGMAWGGCCMDGVLVPLEIGEASEVCG
jgi:hypothetical protein